MASCWAWPKTVACCGATTSAAQFAASPLPPDGHALAVGTAGGYLVLLHKGSGTDPYLTSTSRYAEARRFIFWDDAPAPLAW